MQAIREIKKTSSETITITLPKQLQNRRIEIIILPLEEENQNKEPKKIFSILDLKPHQMGKALVGLNHLDGSEIFDEMIGDDQ